MTNTIRILIVDDHPLVREGLHAVISMEPDLEVIGECGDGAEAMRLTRGLSPDVILMDLLMPGLDGGRAIAAILNTDPGRKILVLTSLDNIDTILDTVKSGALGYVSKNAPPDELLAAIRAVYGGRVVLPAPVMQALLGRETTSPDPLRHPENLLTQREVEVLTFVAQGLNNDDIADRLVISPRTVSVHVSHILTKLELQNRTQAALYALRTGLASL